MKYNYHAITLGKKEIGETDRLYTFYTRENGLMRIPARSIRKSEAKLAAQVEDFVLTSITVVKNYGHGALAGAVAEEFFNELRLHFVALSCVDHARNVFLALIQEHDKDEETFDLFVEYLRKMEELSIAEGDSIKDEQMRWITYAFLIKIFDMQGYVFDAQQCMICRVVPQEHAQHVFDVHSGGLLCVQCAKGKGHACAIQADTIKSLRMIYRHKLSTLGKVVMHADVNRQLLQIVTQIERWVMR